ncbi:MAG: hypothetical protein FWB91_09675 [Defluviitaleaceae bacterium]|nr:hypothetical protein [Defluviitaleaceae bacterium]
MGFLNILLVVASLAVIFVIAYAVRRHTRQQDEINRRFLEEEEAANSVRKKEIESELFYTPDLAALPAIPEGDPHSVKRCAKRTMLRLPRPMTNLELKKQYGLAQMDSIAQYEENFNEYLKAITAWAGDLAEAGELRDALVLLNEAVSLGSEFRNSYKLAADIHVKNRDEIKLQELRFKVTANHFKDPAVRNHVVEYIDSKLASEW